jgi:hypothetical protein
MVAYRSPLGFYFVQLNYALIYHGVKLSSERPIDNRKCKSDDHVRHLCHFVSYGYHINHEEEYRELVENPKLKCYICGRVAHNPEDICDSRKL